ncbi:6085_t:CDS:2 [Ambispora leptoticha]|uniref:6085_t:CDS:1 n=1 Tax=Ambispora leptoticha TaxID=144679 RepID=A0A9N8YUV0_9GLOM|nr:6085_t:CDS:2 [Ambispora leptoticha]
MVSNNNIPSPSNKSSPGSDGISILSVNDSEISTPQSSNSETRNNNVAAPQSTSSRKNSTTLNKFPPGKDLGQNNNSDQTPSRFLAGCSKLDLEPNPFEQSFSHVTPTQENGTQSPKPSLPPVAAITSPSAGIQPNECQYGWNLQSLRSGPLSPSMLEGPQNPVAFDDLAQNGRTGTTPYGNFTDSSLFGSAVNGNITSSMVNPNAMPMLNMNSLDPYVIPPAPVAPNGLISIPNASTNPTSTSSTTNSLVTNPLVPQTVIVNNQNLNNRGFAASSDDGYDDEQFDNMDSQMNVHNMNNVSATSTTNRKTGVRNGRRKTEDNLADQQPPSKRANTQQQKPKEEMSMEEKRRNFLERNRQAALKCRQRKKQWLANLQAKVEYLTQDNESLQNQATQLREEILNLKTLLLAHKDCPITNQANGVMGLDTMQSVAGITSSISGMNPAGVSMGVGMVSNNMQNGGNIPGNVQGQLQMTHVPHMPQNQMNGQQNSLRY